MTSASPNSSWIVGEKQLSPFKNDPFVTINPDDVPSSYSLMIRLVSSLIIGPYYFDNCMIKSEYESTLSHSISNLHSSAITPRPVAFVSTQSAAGISNPITI